VWSFDGGRSSFFLEGLSGNAMTSVIEGAIKLKVTLEFRADAGGEG